MRDEREALHDCCCEPHIWPTTFLEAHCALCGKSINIVANLR